MLDASRTSATCAVDRRLGLRLFRLVDRDGRVAHAVDGASGKTGRVVRSTADCLQHDHGGSSRRTPSLVTRRHPADRHPVAGPRPRQRRGRHLLVECPGVLRCQPERRAERLTSGAVLVAVLTVEAYKRGGHQQQKKNTNSYVRCPEPRTARS